MTTDQKIYAAGVGAIVLSILVSTVSPSGFVWWATLLGIPHLSTWAIVSRRSTSRVFRIALVGANALFLVFLLLYPHVVDPTLAVRTWFFVPVAVFWAGTLALFPLLFVPPLRPSRRRGVARDAATPEPAASTDTHAEFVDAEALSRRRFLAGSMAGVPFLASAAGATDFDRFEVNEIEVEIRDLPGPFEGYRIGQISDIHHGPFILSRTIEDGVAVLSRANLDLAVLTGDFIVSGAAHDLPTLARILSRIEARDGRIAILGNHDLPAGDALAAHFPSAGIALLVDAVRTIRRGGATLSVVGLDYRYLRADAGLAELTARTVFPAGPRILLAHNPNRFDAAARLGYDLTLSGHTHGGQIRIPLLPGLTLEPARLIFPRASGLHRSGNAALYVNRGFGVVGVPIRIACPAELTILTLRRAPGFQA